MLKVQIVLEDGTVDTIAKMLIGYIMAVNPQEDSKYHKKLMATIEFLEEAIDPSFQSVAVYLQVIDLLPATVKRKMPYKIQGFIDMYKDKIEQHYGPIPSKYLSSGIVEPDKRLLDAQGNPIETKIDSFEVGQKLEGTIEEASANPPKLKLV